MLRSPWPCRLVPWPADGATSRSGNTESERRSYGCLRDTSPLADVVGGVVRLVQGITGILELARSRQPLYTSEVLSHSMGNCEKQCRAQDEDGRNPHRCASHVPSFRDRCEHRFRWFVLPCVCGSIGAESPSVTRVQDLYGICKPKDLLT